jgi:hypothetical protein
MDAEAPDQDTAIKGAQEWHAANPLPAPGVAEDVAKSTAIAVPQTAIGLAGLPGTASDLIGRGVNALGNLVTGKTGSYEEFQKKRAAALGGADIAAPTGQAITGAVEKATGPFYEPQTTPGKFANVATQFGLSGGRAGLVPRLASGAGFEAAREAAQGTPYEIPAAIGGALAVPAGMAGLRRAVTPLPMQAAQVPYVNTLQAEGVPLSAGAITGSKPLQTLEQALGNVPGAGRAGAASLEQTGEGFTRAALRRVGEDAPRATPEVIDRAFTRIGDQFDTLAARNTLRPDAQFGRDVQATVGDYRNLVSPPNRAPLIENFEAEIGSQIARHNGVIPGDTYQSLSSRLERAARGAAAQPEVAMTLRDLRGALDRNMERGLAQSGSPDLGAWRQARTQYRNMLTIERAATAAGSETAKGLISPSALRNATIVKQGRRNYGRGEGDFADLARAGEAVLKPLPTSGTSERTYAQHLPAVIATLIGSLFGGTPGVALAAGAALAGPPIAGRVLHSRPVQAYLRNQALAGPRVPALPNLALPLAIATERR